MKKTYYALIILPAMLIIIPMLFYVSPMNKKTEMKKRNNYAISDNGEKKESAFPKSKGADAETNLGHARESAIKGYMIKSEKDNIYIYEMYENGFSEKIKALDINPMFLRKTDKEELEKGIVKSSYVEICSLIEDYSS